MLALSRELKLLLCLTLPFSAAQGFRPGIHARLVSEAFTAVKEADRWAERQTAADMSVQVDDPVTNDDPNQYRHSMRSSGDSTEAGRRKTNDYMEREFQLAVAAARQGRPEAAAEHLGRILHAIQDRKHNWCSCSRESNPPDSNENCGDSCTPGKGHHGLNKQCDWWSADILHHQVMTDASSVTGKGYYALARQESIDLLNRFVQAVTHR